MVYRASDLFWLKKALALAHKARGQTCPNPAVGAVVVKKGLLGEGYHCKAGEKHAEILALESCSESPQGATLYVTLEPCCHWGKTPPCVKAIVEAGIQRVVYAQKDPNPQVKGKGHLFLEQKGIVVEAISLPEIASFYQSYCFWVLHRRPLLSLKLALSLDGKLALSSRPFSLTSEKAKAFVHQQRFYSDVFLTTAATILADNPHFVIRKKYLPSTWLLEGQQSAYIERPLAVLDRKGRLKNPSSLNIFNYSRKVWLYRKKELGLSSQTKGDVVFFQDLKGVWEDLKQKGFFRVWIECGPRFWPSLLGWVDEIFFITTPWVLGSQGDDMGAFFSSPLFFPSQYKVEIQKYGTDVVYRLEKKGVRQDV